MPGERGDPTEAWAKRENPKSDCPPHATIVGPQARRRSASVKVLIGMDPHKSANAVAAIDENGEIISHTAFPANRRGLQALEQWSKRFPERRWAVEGAAGVRPASGVPWRRSWLGLAKRWWTCRPSFRRR